MTTNGLDAKASLDPAIQPVGQVIALDAPPRAFFLTGATGFIGAYLLRELLETTSATAYALVRASDPANALDRIRKNLQTYALWEEWMAARIVPVVGDLKNPLFGLTQEEFTAIGAAVDVIFHCGSKLSYIAPYEYLDSANVGGTHEALRLATTVNTKPLHYVSSLGILLDYKEPVGGAEDDELDEDKVPGIGYFQTKYVAERLVRMARDRGIPVTVHRIGLIVGDSRTGISNEDDFVARMIVGSIQTGYAPDVRANMDMTPVDFVSSAMIYLSRQQSSAGKVFHLLNPQPVNWSGVFDLAAEVGYASTKLPFSEWVEKMDLCADPSTNPLCPLLPFFHINFARRMMGVNGDDYMALHTDATQAALASSGITCAPINSHFMSIYLSHFVQHGRLSATIELT
ncbi:MAG: thioester reductase domain-containing protein [Chloroflexi bacterium]|uniref:thioester reductase domain-containing protein n=1 Tax=Candidatus Flexifilum breve TaxID=3140694 RepID=UPI0031352FBB|nr:thioester reductase domain-containing protein [Chloroflexota bacterium]MBK9751389.1 thioester reductase domain-containing protein [Chloroflexota bacterium]